MSKNETTLTHPLRHMVVLSAIAVVMLFLFWRAVDLHALKSGFLQEEGDARHLRVLKMAAHRGMITDRNGDPLAMSTPVDSVWANPREMQIEREQWPQLAKLLNMKIEVLQRRLSQRRERSFVYLQRRINPNVAQAVMALSIPGISLQREYRRYYPAGEVAAHVVGFTNIDDEGQEGLELAYDQWLQGTAGSKRVIKDRLGRVVENVESIAEPLPGKALRLSIDRRIQYLAYRELTTTVQQHKASSGSAIVLDVRSGEVLAMVNRPSYNPNNRSTLHSGNYRNRAVTDVFEPGSTIKPFTVAAGLEAGKLTPKSLIDTSPGVLRVGRKAVRDLRDYGPINMATILKKSSNVGASKIALGLQPEQMREVFSQFGFGDVTDSGFPGESAGQLTDSRRWRDIDRATLSYGYGLSVTALQLAQAYSVVAGGGILKPVSFVALDDVTSKVGKQVISKRTAKQIMSMLEGVIADGGTGTLARVPGFRIAGKTGTVQKYGAAGYSDERYVSLFAGAAPASRPRLVMVVMIDEPHGEEYYGGRVAAPVFSRVMAGALRILGVAPDDVEDASMRSASLAHVGTKVL